MKEEPTELNPSSITNEGQGDNQEQTTQDFGLGEDFMSRLDSDLQSELADKVPAKMDADAQIKDIEAKQEQLDEESAKLKEDKSESKKSKEEPKEVIDPTKVEAKEGEQSDEDPDKEVLESEAPGGKHASQETKVNWKKLQEVAKKAKDEVGQYKSELSQLKEQVSKFEESSKNAQVPQDVEQELNYLRSKVAELDLASAPQFKQKFDAQIEKVEQSLLSEFKKIEDTGAPNAKDITEKLQKAIKDAGGVTQYNWPALLDLCEEHKLINGIQRRKIEGQVATAEQIVDQKSQELAKASEYYQQNREKTAAETQQLVKSLDTKIREYATKPGNEWTVAPKDPGAKATAEEKASYKEAMEFYNEGTLRFKKMVNGLLTTYGVGAGDVKVEPDEFIDIAFDAVKAMKLDRDLKSKDTEVTKLNEKVAELEEELSKFRKAGNTSGTKSTPKSGSTSKVDKKVTTNRNDLMADIDGDLEKFIGDQS